MKHKRNRRRWRVFGGTFMTTFCLLLLGAGFLVVDYNTRLVTTGGEDTPLPYRMKDGLIRVENPENRELLTLPPSYAAWVERAWSVLPARWRAAAWVIQAENMTIPWILDSRSGSQEETEEDWLNVQS